MWATSRLLIAFDPFWSPKPFIALQSWMLLQDDVHIMLHFLNVHSISNNGFAHLPNKPGQVHDPTIPITIDLPPLSTVQLVAHSKCFVGTDRFHRTRMSWRNNHVKCVVLN